MKNKKKKRLLIIIFVKKPPEKATEQLDGILSCVEEKEIGNIYLYQTCFETVLWQRIGFIPLSFNCSPSGFDARRHAKIMVFIRPAVHDFRTLFKSPPLLFWACFDRRRQGLWRTCYGLGNNNSGPPGCQEKLKICVKSGLIFLSVGGGEKERP